MTITKRSGIHRLAYLLPSSFTLGSAWTEEGDPVISCDWTRDSCQSWPGTTVSTELKNSVSSLNWARTSRHRSTANQWLQLLFIALH